MSFDRHLIGSLAVAAILAPSLAQADTKWYDKLSLSGNVDAYYQLFLNEPASNDYFNGNTANFSGDTGALYEVQHRAFDARANSAQYNADLTLNYADEASKTSAAIELIYGPKGDIINTGNNTFENNWGSSAPVGYTVAQAYVKQGLGPVSFTLGKFATPVGLETWGANANANYSRGILYQQEPFYSLGAKLDYAAPFGIGASLWLDNGNSVDYTWTDAKNWGVGLSYTGVKGLSLNAQWYEDQNAYGSNWYENSWGYNGYGWNNDYIGFATDQGWFDTVHLIDINFTYQVMASLSVSGEYLYKTAIDGKSADDQTRIENIWGPGYWGMKYSPKAQGYSLSGVYTTPIANLSIGGRWEQWNSPDLNAGTSYHNGPVGGMAVGLWFYTLNTYTLTAKYQQGALTHILEYRLDAANDDEYAQDSNFGNYGVGYTSNQQTLTYAVVYGF